MPFLSYPAALQLKKELGEQMPDDYLQSISHWSDTCAKGAGAVVKVTSAQEVSMVIAFATKQYIPFVVYSGGFNTSGASSTYGGIVISLENMHSVAVNPKSNTVTVQGGARWVDVDKAAAEHGLAVVGATANHLSVGGTTLGGGLGWLTGSHGLIIDNLLSVKMVLANTHIVTASISENPDLFWAVRGAGQDFGVATEFTFKAYPQRDSVFAGLLFFKQNVLEKIVEFANKLDKTRNGNQGMFFGFTDYMQETAIVAILFYNGIQEEAEKFFEPILSLSPVRNNTKMMPYFEANGVVNVAARATGRKRISGTSIKPPLDIDLIREIYREFDMVMANYPVGNSMMIFEIVPYDEVVKVPNDATAYANRGRYYNVASIFCWEGEQLDGRMKTLQHFMMNKIRQHSFHYNDDGVGVYANYAGYETNAKELFGDNLPRLQELKKKYDPNNVFRKWHDLLVETGSVG
ncbi:putative FAD binding oxidoreductase [Talaromyces proteolyticus]|uniref:FAD binding oxidoreductase n=1 Tax=Talaromyces proteolyticus TaxID=1131652 RepID=A0AAD4KDQ6_9EURO|nr:putative FAD binding oxidoreductase [Talaromyces proteolyticus]KAH8689151.1 putative FAD binding oxidoreductase [Talaromyces proteolyticus]